MNGWKDISGYKDKYQINSLGQVRSTIGGRERILSTNLSVYGYVMVRLSNKNKRRAFFLHRLLAIAFIPNPNNKPCINHINGIKHDNRLCNLEWCTTKENNHHAIRIGNGRKRPIRLYNESYCVSADEFGNIIGIYASFQQASVAAGVSAITVSRRAIRQSGDVIPRGSSKRIRRPPRVAKDYHWYHLDDAQYARVESEGIKSIYQLKNPAPNHPQQQNT